MLLLKNIHTPSIREKQLTVSYFFVCEVMYVLCILWTWALFSGGIN